MKAKKLKQLLDVYDDDNIEVIIKVENDSFDITGIELERTKQISDGKILDKKIVIKVEKL
jgi:hypothetical protein